VAEPPITFGGVLFGHPFKNKFGSFGGGRIIPFKNLLVFIFIKCILVLGVHCNFFGKLGAILIQSLVCVTLQIYKVGGSLRKKDIICVIFPFLKH
jgi:hypothetical protein